MKNNIKICKSKNFMITSNVRVIALCLLVLACFAACISAGAYSVFDNEKLSHAHADTNGDICCSYKQTSTTSATIQVTGVASYTATSADPTIATVSQSGENVTVTGVSEASGIAPINIAYPAGTYTVEVPIGYTVFSFDENKLTVMPGLSTNYQIDGIDYTQQDEIEGLTPTSTEPYEVYTNSDDVKINVSLNKKGGTYVFTGRGDNMSIAVKKGASSTSTLLMADCHLTSKVTSPLTIKKDSSVQTVINALAGHSNSLTDNEFNNADIYGPTEDGGTGENQHWAESAVIKAKAKANVLLNGNGSLTLSCKSKNAIKVGDSGNLTMENIHLDVKSVDHGIASDNTTTINSGSLVLDTVGDALRSDPSDIVVGTTSGTIAINGGTFDISTNSNGDGIQAAADLKVADGDFNITTGGGHTQSIAEDDSAKGLKSGITMEISGGEFVFDCADDAVHADSDLTITSGEFKIATADDAIHAGDKDIYKNAKLSLGVVGATQPYVNITSCYEGLEGAQVVINSGTYNIVGTDDGINSANGTPPAPGPTPPGSAYDEESAECDIVVNGGNIFVNVDGDGFDANGDIIINSGKCVVFGAKRGGGNNPYDCDGDFLINGGEVFGAGEGVLAPTPKGSQSYITYGKTNSDSPASIMDNNLNLLDGENPHSINDNLDPDPGPGPGPGPGEQEIKAGQTIDVKNASSSTAFSVKSPKDVGYVLYSSSSTTSSWSIIGDDTTPTWTSFTMPDCLISGHNFTSTYVVEPNCLGVGTIKKTCSVCGATSYETTDALGHNMVDDVCTRCGYSEAGKTDISPAIVSEIEEQTFTGNAIMPTPTVTLNDIKLVYDQDYSLSYADNVNVGTAIIYITGCGNYKGTITKNFTINKAPIDVPQAVAEKIVYDGYDHIGVPAGEGYFIENNSHRDAGTYVAVATLDSNHIWSDGKTEPSNIPWTIYQAEGKITFDKSSIEVVKDYSETIVPKIVSDGEISASSDNTGVAIATFEDGVLTVYGISEGNANITVSASAGTNYTAASANLSVNVVLTGKAKIPTAKVGLVYNGAQQTGVEAGTGFTLENSTATNAGSYTAIASLQNGYIWEDDTSDSKQIAWTIAKADGQISLEQTSIIVESGSSTSVTFNRLGDGVVTAQSSDDEVATVSVSESSLIINGEQQGGNCLIDVMVAEGTNYNAANAELSVQVSYVPIVSSNGITLRGAALEQVLNDGEEIQLDVNKLTNTDEGYIRAYNEFMTTGNYQQMFAYDVELGALDSVTGDKRTITELPDTVEMTISIGTSEYDGGSADVQEYHSTDASNEVTIPYKGLNVDDEQINLNVKNFSQFNALLVADSVVPNEGNTDSDTASAVSTSETGDTLAAYIAFAIFLLVVAGFCAYIIRRKITKK